MKRMYETAMKLYSTGDITHAKKVIEQMKECDPSNCLAHFAQLEILSSQFSNDREVAKHSADLILQKNRISDYSTAYDIGLAITELRRSRDKISFSKDMGIAIKNAKAFCSKEQMDELNRYLYKIRSHQVEIIEKEINRYESMYDVKADAEELVEKHFISYRNKKKNERIFKTFILGILAVAIVFFGYITVNHAFDIPEESTITEGFWLFCLVCTALNSFIFIKVLTNFIIEE